MKVFISSLVGIVVFLAVIAITGGKADATCPVGTGTHSYTVCPTTTTQPPTTTTIPPTTTTIPEETTTTVVETTTTTIPEETTTTIPETTVPEESTTVPVETTVPDSTLPDTGVDSTTAARTGFAILALGIILLGGSFFLRSRSV